MSGFTGYDQNQGYWNQGQGQGGQGQGQGLGQQQGFMGQGGFFAPQQDGSAGYGQPGQVGQPNAWNRPLQHQQGPPGLAYGEYGDPSQSFFSGLEPAAMGMGGYHPQQDNNLYLRMRGLPYSAVENDVYNFFQGLNVQHVQLCYDQQNRLTGEAYVQFGSVNDRNQGMNLDKKTMGSRYIELFEATPQEVPMVGNGSYGGVNMGWGDPNMVGQGQGQAGYNGQGYPQQGGAGMGPGPGQGGGQVYGGGDGAQGQGGAPPQHQGGHQQARSGPGSYAGRGGWAAAAARQPAGGAGHGPPRGRGYQGHHKGNNNNNSNSSNNNSGNSGSTPNSANTNPGDEDTTILRLRGLPYSAGEDEIREFFSGQKVDAVHIVTGFDGRPSGEAYVEFASSADATEGMGKNRESIGSRYIELFRSTRQDMTNRIKPRGGRSGGPSKDYDRAATLRLRGLPYRIGAKDVLEFFNGYETIPESVQFGQDYSGRSNGEAWVTFTSQEEALRAQKERDRAHMGSRYVELFTL
eukprot:TRINITY_DN21_c2_g1_i1.p1 TRINITY_DN21_c2_g1~~TRINITY_DN21_c2_g1_i1.p1  ORF type:complete len:518 (-),score=131.16 TRINITY_DN21_c2_g1_i1:1419-2972(-)